MKRILLCLLFILSAKDFNAQNNLTYLSYVFPQDSLNGYNESYSSNVALTEGYFGIEYKVFMYRSKRSYINEKYKYFYPVPINASSISNNRHVDSTSCNNQEFESVPVGSVTSVLGWTITEGSNTNSCLMLGCCSAAPTGTNSWIRATPIINAGPIQPYQIRLWVVHK